MNFFYNNKMFIKRLIIIILTAIIIILLIMGRYDYRRIRASDKFDELETIYAKYIDLHIC